MIICGRKNGHTRSNIRWPTTHSYRLLLAAYNRRDGSSITQANLSSLISHCWHSPITGITVKAYLALEHSALKAQQIDPIPQDPLYKGDHIHLRREN